jgi:phenylacetate-coenzyme A ligase PaaK-like adenylate-forming protein
MALVFHQYNIEKLRNRIFSVADKNLEELALKIFHFQYQANSVYRKYVEYLEININKVKSIPEIPFLPIEFFKSKEIILDELKAEVTFFSSATTGISQSRHLVADIGLYKESFMKAFEYFFGNPQDYCFLALLPSYLEREGSSLIYMINELMKISSHPDNGYYLNEYKEIDKKIGLLEKQNQKYILFGVSYALIDFAEKFTNKIESGIVMETGGMKGRRKEISKPELYEILNKAYKTKRIYSEYGMTELLSQAYSMGNNLFQSPPWMRILIRDINDPFSYAGQGISGGINVIDLANLYSCCFIETKDLGKMNQNGQFEILGRFDNSDIRGCNLLVN